MVGVGKTKNKNFEQGQMSPQNIYAKWNPKKKLHAWPWSTQLLCTSISLKSRKRSKADFTVGNVYSWLTIFRKDRVLLSCTVGPCFQNWIYEVMFNMFLSVEGVNPLLELEKRRQVQRLMNDSWRKTIKCINAPRLTPPLVCRAPGRSWLQTLVELTTRVFKKQHGEVMLDVI